MCLHFVGELADFVKEERPAIGLAHQSLPLGHPRIRVVPHVPEELRVNDPRRERGRIAGDEGTSRTLGESVNRASRELLVRPGCSAQ
jgi:hypothetical protein